MFKKIAITLTLVGVLSAAVPALANTTDIYREGGINMMGSMMGSQLNDYQAAWRQQYGDAFVDNMYQAMGQYAANNPEAKFGFNKASRGYGMMGGWGSSNQSFGLMHFAGFVVFLIWVVNSVLIGYLLVALILKLARKK
jgi:hypothetical protein